MKIENKQWHKITWTIVLFVLGLISAANFVMAAPNSGVLVASENSIVSQEKILEIRRIYLGLPASPESSINASVINLSDKFVYKQFLKNIMHMTEKGYQRKMVKRVFRLGSRRLKEFTSKDDLVKHLIDNPGEVSFMEKTVAERTQGIKVVQVLW